MRYFKPLMIMSLLAFVKANSQGNLSNYELSSAMYRELKGGNGGHWHSALFLYFEYLNDKGIIRYSEQGGGGSSGSSDWNSFLTVPSVQSTITENMVDLTNLKQSLRNQFCGSLTYTGTYSNSATPLNRYEIATTGWQLGSSGNALGIGYTWVDMLDYNWFDWDGTIEDIDEIRCDGISEYSYEKNNSLVALGNIATPNTESVELHNNLDDGFLYYNYYELCPRIQAGEDHNGSGKRSTFDPLVSTPPSSSNFSVNQFSGYVQLNFKISDNASVKTYVMLQVKRSNESAWQLITDSYGYFANI